MPRNWNFNIASSNAPSRVSSWHTFFFIYFSKKIFIKKNKKKYYISKSKNSKAEHPSLRWQVSSLNKLDSHIYICHNFRESPFWFLVELWCSHGIRSFTSNRSMHCIYIDGRVRERERVDPIVGANFVSGFGATRNSSLLYRSTNFIIFYERWLNLHFFALIS